MSNIQYPINNKCQTAKKNPAVFKILKLGIFNLKFIGCLSFVIWNCCFLVGCTSEYNLATGRQETLMYSTDKEINLGHAYSKRMEKEYEVVHDVDMNERVEKILDRITAVSDRKDIVYSIKVLDKDDLNAVSLPGGYIYVFKGLLEKTKNDDQLAGIIAHEVGHVTARHAVKRMQAAYSALAIQAVAIATAPKTANGVGLALGTIFTQYSQEDEFEADRLAVKYLKKAGYDTAQMANTLSILREAEKKEPLRPVSYWRTHPHLSSRIAAVNQETTGKIEFKDYLNLTGEKQ